MTLALSVEQLQALDTARSLAAAGVPVFVAPPADTATGFALPAGWQRTPPDPAAVDAWRPGWALCAVMGHGLDLLDVDPRNGGDLDELGTMPSEYGVADTPSGGRHHFIASLSVGSRDGIAQGIDLKAGRGGEGHGFAFLAPTVRRSKVTGEPGEYRWRSAPSAAAPWRAGTDTSGSALAARVRALRAGTAVSRVGGPTWWQAFLANKDPQSAPAAERAIAEKVGEIERHPATPGAGFRTCLLRAAMTLGGYVGGGYLAESDACARLEAAITSVWGAVDDDDRLWIQQGLTDGALQPFHVLTADEMVLNSPAALAVAAEGEDPNEGVEPWNVRAVLDPATPFDPVHASSDQDLAQAVAYRMYPALRYANDAGVWVKRERDVWVEHTEDMTDWVISLLAELMPLGEHPVPKDVTQRTAGHWQAVRRAQFMSSAGTGKVGRKLRAIVRSDHPATLQVAKLDANPEILWAGAVPWDLRASGDIPTPAYWIDPNTPHLHTALCAPNPSVPTPRWDAFLAAVLPDPEVRVWTLRVLSIALTGHPDAALPILFGRERSGKSSLVEMLVTLLGSYGFAASTSLVEGKERPHPADVYELRGRRLAFIDEGPGQGHHATERIKQFTGGTVLSGAAKYARPVSFRPTHTIVMTTNKEPHLTDPALRARVRLIPCDEPEGNVRPARLPLLGPGLRNEAPGILAAMMREAAAYLADRDSASTTAAPITVRSLAQEMAEGQDPVREWVESCTVPSEPGTPGRTLHAQHFATWHQAHPLYRRSSVPTEHAFGRVLTEMGFPPQKLHGRWYRALSVLNSPPSTPPTTPAAFMAVSGASGASVAVPSTGSANPHNRTSDPVFVPPSGALADVGGYKFEEVVGRDVERSTETLSATNRHRQEEVQKRGLTCNDAPGGSTLAEPPPKPVTPRSVSATDAAARATADKITKAEARKRVSDERKAAERQAKIDAAAGELLGLPAVADREGHALPVTLEQAQAVVRSALARSGELTVDVEHTGYPIGHADYRLKTVQLGDEVAAAVFDPVEHAEVIHALLEAAPRLVAHSATADLAPLAVEALGDAESMWARMHDTVIPAKLADPQSTGSDPGLKALSGAVLGASSVAPAADASREGLWKAAGWSLTKQQKFADQLEMPLERNGWAQVDPRCATMVRYAASDVLDTAALSRRLPVIPPVVLDRERLAQRMTARVAHRGVRIDVDRVRELTTQHTEARAQWAATLAQHGIANPGSSSQVAEALTALGAPLPRSAKTGAPSAAAGAVEPLRGADAPYGRLADAVLQWRRHNTALGLFLKPYRLLCEHGDGRARPTVYTLGTDTGRMSCVRPNLQQLPREGGVRSCITADRGQLMIGADFSSVEVRVAAALSGDMQLQQMLRDGRDLHGEIARLVWGPDATKAHRYKAKPMVFQRIYGGGVPGISRQHGVSTEVAQAVVDAMDVLTPQLVAWGRTMQQHVRAGRTQFESYSGRIIHLSRQEPHKTLNYLIQGSARELLIDALVRWSDTRWGTATLLPVHDELDAFVPAEDAQEATAALVSCMRTELYGVSIVADPSAPVFAWADSA